jgi:hypothetical protein
MWHREDLAEKDNSLNQKKEENYRQYEFWNHRSDKDQRNIDKIKQQEGVDEDPDKLDEEITKCQKRLVDFVTEADAIDCKYDVIHKIIWTLFKSEKVSSRRGEEDHHSLASIDGKLHSNQYFKRQIDGMIERTR